MTRAFEASHDSQAVVPSADVLQLMWLGHHSAPVREVLAEVEYPTDADLRRAGTRELCFAKKICEEGIQLSVRNSQIFLVRHLPFIPYTVHAHSYACTSFLRRSLEQH
jgi:hypothetical protein